MKIIKQSRTVDIARYHLFFEDLDCPGSGLAFDCDASGCVKPSDRRGPRYDQCLTGSVDGRRVGAGRVVKEAYSYRESAVGLCNHCGAEVELGEFTCTCVSCGADYNWAGQELGPREYWGEETGEHWTECIGPFPETKEE